MENVARRIRARAIRRCGELLIEVPRGNAGGRPDPESAPADSTMPPQPPGRMIAAEKAGLTRHQANDAIRVAKIPEAEFEERVETPRPPGIRQLVDNTKRAERSHLGGRDPKDFQAATTLMGIFRHVTLQAQSFDLEAAFPWPALERQGLEQKFASHIEWLGKVHSIVFGNMKADLKQANSAARASR